MLNGNRLEIAAVLGLAGSAAGFALGFGIMALRALDGTDYYWWTWWAIPVFWGVSALASLIVPTRPLIGAAGLLYIAATGSFYFSDVYGYAAGALLVVAALLAVAARNVAPGTHSPDTESMEGDG